MTEPPPPARNGKSLSRVAKAPLLAILLLAAALRIYGVDFGLPALNDPDEPLFMMTAMDMLRSHSLDPHWFGHPATITFYSLALVMLGVGAAGLASGRFADLPALVAAGYRDPALLFLPARLLFVACGTGCVWLVWRLGRQLGGARVGLVAAAFLAVNAVHIRYSQLIRTDVQASLFMLLAVLAALDIARHGRTRDYLLAGLWVGLGCATKWPAALILLSPVGAAAWRLRGGHRDARRLALLLGAVPVTLLLASPYLLVEYRAVLGNLVAEARPVHPGATGGGFVANLGWYLWHPLLQSLGIGGLALAIAGAVWLPLRDRAAACALLPGPLALFAVTCAQALLWERWIVPLLPFAALTSAFALCAGVDRLRLAWRRPLRLAEPVAAVLLMLPMLHAARVAATERAYDTRQAAAAWVRAHVPPGQSILVEHAALDLMQGPWRVLFPLGSAGCVDARAALAGHIRYDRVETLRAGSPVLDLAHVTPARLGTCHADYAIISHYTVYRESPSLFARELAQYRAIMRGGRIEATFEPRPRFSSGPAIQILRLRPSAEVPAPPASRAK